MTDITHLTVQPSNLQEFVDQLTQSDDKVIALIIAEKHSLCLTQRLMSKRLIAQIDRLRGWILSRADFVVRALFHRDFIPLDILHAINNFQTFCNASETLIRRLFACLLRHSVRKDSYASPPIVIPHTKVLYAVSKLYDDIAEEQTNQRKCLIGSLQLPNSASKFQRLETAEHIVAAKIRMMWMETFSPTKKKDMIWTWICNVHAVNHLGVYILDSATRNRAVADVEILRRRIRDVSPLERRVNEKVVGELVRLLTVPRLEYFWLCYTLAQLGLPGLCLMNVLYNSHPRLHRLVGDTDFDRAEIERSARRLIAQRQ